MGRSRVCFASSVISSDEFLELPPMAQAVYFQLAVDADNDGAVDGFKRKIRSYGATDEDAQALIDAGYLLEVNGVFFITHWRVNNRTDNKNYREGGHPRELALINCGENHPYTWDSSYQSDISLISDANIKETNTDQTETNGDKTNEIESYPIKRKTNAYTDGDFVPCPVCGTHSRLLQGVCYCEQCMCRYIVTPDGEIQLQDT